MALIQMESREPTPEAAIEHCRQLEAGNVLFFPESPIPIDRGDLDFLLSSQQSGSGLHKNIAYKPGPRGTVGVLTGIDQKASPAARERLLRIVAAYSQSVDRFLSQFLSPYQGRWRLDYASYRPQEEQGRNLTLRRRNDLLHTDAFPTRPTGGSRILRFFNNIHPSRTRDWVVGDPFATFIGQIVPGRMSPPSAESAGRRMLRKLAASTALGKLVPSLKRAPYDAFMMRLHNSMKEDAGFQRDCVKYPLQLPPGSSWMVYTDMVPHTVLAGQYALEQTFLVERTAMVSPENAPLTVLESMTKSPLA